MRAEKGMKMKKAKAGEMLIDCLATIYVEQKVKLCEIAKEILLNNAPETRDEYDAAFIKLNNSMFELVQSNFLRALMEENPETISFLYANEELKSQSVLPAEHLYAVGYYALTGKKSGVKGQLMAKQLQDVAIKDVIIDILSKK